MLFPSDQEFSLAGSAPDGRRPYISTDGAFIGWGVPLLERTSNGGWKPRAAAVIEELLSHGYGAPFQLGWRYEKLGYVAKALSEGNLFLASLSLLHAQFPPLASEAHARAMARAEGSLAKENPNWESEPRVPAGNPDGGEWTTDGGSSVGGLLVPAAGRGDDTQTRKERFVDAHIADAQRIADQLHVPVENVLGVSAVESGW